jgi:hypothetical protein
MSSVSPKYQLKETGPVIAEIIGRLYAASSAPVPTAAIRAALMSHPIGRTLVTRAWERRQHDWQTMEWFAMAILASFAQSISQGSSSWAGQFDQLGVSPDYSYVPRQPKRGR